MTSILSEIHEWGATLQYWEQAALIKILSDVAFTDDVLEELLQFLLEDAGLAPSTTPHPNIDFSPLGQGAGEIEKHSSIRLKRIYNTHNINALVPDQVLEFCESLTVIFGSNGSGKSGYARVLASASFTRGDKQILGDITKPFDENLPHCADFDLVIEDKPKTIHFEVGHPCPEMQAFYVFDSTSVRNHLSRSNPMSFSPAGLEFLTRLSEVTDAVRTRLQRRVEFKKCENSFTLLFIGGDTDVSRIIKTLSSQTEISVIRQLGTLSDEEIQRIPDLDHKIAELKVADIPRNIHELDQAISDLNQLVKKLNDLEITLSDLQVTLVIQIIQEWQRAKQVLMESSAEQFQNPWFKKTGERVWQEFILAAYQLSEEEKSDVQNPIEESRCLLCHQPLDSDAQDLIRRLWEYLLSDAQDRLDEANATLDSLYKQIIDVDFDLLDDQNVSRRHLQSQDTHVLESTSKYIGELRKRSEKLISLIQSRQIGDIIPLPESPLGQIQQIIGRLSANREDLGKREIEKEIQVLEQENIRLVHRQILSGVMGEVIEFVENQKWIEKASSPRVKRSTVHISKKYNELFDRLVTQEYLRLFQNSLRELNCPLIVQIETHAQKGETFKQIALHKDASIPIDQAQPEKILSEGEQRAVALADFFTEVRLDTHSCGVVLDDPVTSLDFHWKEAIAKFIVEQASQQQVIVFTHDLHFLYLIKNNSETADLPMQTHWIEKRDDKPGWVFINNSPLSEKDYKSSKIPTTIYESALDPRISPEELQMRLGQGFAALRTCYEAFIIYDLFNGVVERFEERTRTDLLKEVIIDPDIRDQVVEKIGYLSRLMDGHLHSDAVAAQKPTLDILKDEILFFNALKGRMKEIRKLDRSHPPTLK